ncbi:MAG: hypothetical protein AAB442_03240 [Patescibacteria group bacterium]
MRHRAEIEELAGQKVLRENQPPNEMMLIFVTPDSPQYRLLIEAFVPDKRLRRTICGDPVHILECVSLDFFSRYAKILPGMLVEEAPETIFNSTAAEVWVAVFARHRCVAYEIEPRLGSTH